MNIRCQRCGKPLSNPKSIENRYGPVCNKIINQELKQNHESMEKGPREENNYPSFADYFQQIFAIESNKEKTICACGTKLRDGDFDHYLNVYDGWWLKGWKYQQWLYLECPKCKIAKAFHHLRIDRPFGNNSIALEIQNYANKTMNILQKENRKNDLREKRFERAKKVKQNSLNPYLEV